jgi:hypothetical protein
MTCQDYNVSWTEIVSCVAPSLSEFDDVRLWELAIAEIFRDAQYLCELRRFYKRSPILSEVGACSHWQRPHQHRWLADGSFAAPYGYGGTGFKIHAKPEFDWSIRFAWSASEHGWVAAEGIPGKRPLTLRVTVPTRTNRHHQAAVHTIWTPGSPTSPKQQVIRLYGFRKEDGEWKCTASAGHEFPYAVRDCRE